MSNVFDPRRFVLTARVGGAGKEPALRPEFRAHLSALPALFPRSHAATFTQACAADGARPSPPSSGASTGTSCFAPALAVGARLRYQSLIGQHPTVGGRYLATVSAGTSLAGSAMGRHDARMPASAADERPNFRLLPGYGMQVPAGAAPSPLALDLATAGGAQISGCIFSIAIAF